MEFRQLWPNPGTVEVERLLYELVPGERATVERPHTAVNFIATVDGHATYSGRSGALGDDGDKAMFHGLREQFDAVLAGTGTLRTERYGRILAKPERRQRRVEHGLTAEPLACIFTRSGELPDDIPLFDEPEARVVIFTSRPRRRKAWKAQVEEVEIDGASFTVGDALQQLRAEYGIRSVLCEGGPSLFGAMLQQHVVDELFLTVAPWLAGGGGGPSVTMGPQLPELAPARLLWLLERANSLFLRYGLT